MCKENILSEEEKQSKRSQIAENRLKKQSLNETANIADSTTCMSQNQYNSSDSSHSIPSMELNVQNSVSSNTIYYMNNTFPMETTEINSNISNISNITEINTTNCIELNAIEKSRLDELSMAVNFLNQRPMTNITYETSDLVDLIKWTDYAIKKLITMCKMISSFISLCQEDQIALLKPAITEIIILRSCKTFNFESEYWTMWTVCKR